MIDQFTLGVGTRRRTTHQELLPLFSIWLEEIILDEESDDLEGGYGEVGSLRSTHGVAVQAFRQ